jgi:hypothetical protein
LPSDMQTHPEERETGSGSSREGEVKLRGT